MSNNTQLYVKALAIVQSNLNTLLSVEEIKKFEVELKKLQETYPNQDDFVDETLDFLERELPVIYQEIQMILGDNVDKERIQLLSGVPSYLPPGTILVCPTCSQEHELRDIGEWPVFCKNDGQKLYPKAEE